MARDTHRVVPRGDDWAVQRDGGKKPSRVLDNKQEAVDMARSISRNQKTELVIHNKNGKISRSDSHGNDPCPPKDKK
jgi:uncharacterized protein YdaT